MRHGLHGHTARQHHVAPTAFGVVVLEDAGNAALPLLLCLEKIHDDLKLDKKIVSFLRQRFESQLRSWPKKFYKRMLCSNAAYILFRLQTNQGPTCWLFVLLVLLALLALATLCPPALWAPLLPASSRIGDFLGAFEDGGGAFSKVPKRSTIPPLAELLTANPESCDVTSCSWPEDTATM